MQRKFLIFAIITVLGAALFYNLTTIEASAQCGGIMCLIPNSAQDVYLTENPQIKFDKIPFQRPPVETPASNPSSSTSEQSPPSGSSGGGGLMGLVARGAQDVYLAGSCSEGQVLDEQSGFCVPNELEAAEEQPQAAEEQPQAAEEQTEESQPEQLEQPEQQSSDDEGDGLDDNSDDDNGDGGDDN
jgi:hypothetical protein